MYYRIEYLSETTDETSICHTIISRSDDLDGAEADAMAQAGVAKTLFGATGFQVRHINSVDEVVAICDFDS